MQRDLLKKLQSWRTQADRRPLLLRGAFFVGKTWLVHEFGHQEYSRIAYIDFSHDEALREVFSGDFSAHDLLLATQLHCGFKLYPRKTLIVLDEIQQCPRAFEKLIRFYRETPEYHIIAVESQVAHAYPAGTGYPPPEVETMFLRPLSFSEFLRAIGRAQQADFLDNRDWKLLSSFHDTYISQLILYSLVGGMPQAVQKYARHNDFLLVRKEQESILLNYQDTFRTHARKGLRRRLELLWEAVTAKAERANRKFRYNEVAKGLGNRELEEPMNWLIETGLVRHIARVRHPGLPLEGYRDGAFKCFLPDIGLLTAKLELPMTNFLLGAKFFAISNGVLAEQLVQQEITATMGEKPHYWSSIHGESTADFLVQSGGMVVPVDVSGQPNKRAKSLRVYCERFRPKLAVRVSLAKYQKQVITLPATENAPAAECTVIDLPLYAVSQLAAEIQEAIPAPPQND